MKPKSYKAKVTYDDGWFIAEVTGLRASTGGKGGIVTQGRDLDELAFMVRDAIETMTDTTGFDVQLDLPASVKIARRPRPAASRKRAHKAA